MLLCVIYLYMAAGSIKVAVVLANLFLWATAPDSGWLYSHSVFIAYTARRSLAQAVRK